MTVAWKEWRELLNRRGSTKVTILSVGVILGVFGVLQPAERWEDWFTGFSAVLFLALVPVILIISTIADSFAGERERHTLETLLATRLSDDAILGGKLIAALGWGWGVSLLAALLGAVTVNVARVQHGLGPAFYDASVLGPSIGLALLAGGLMAGFGILVSLRASSVRVAQQIMALSIAGIVALVGVGVGALPESTRAQLLRWLVTHSLWTIVLLAGGFLLALDVVLLVAARSRFRRAKLVLD